MAERQLTRDTIEQLLDQFEPTWELQRAELADSGYLSVYHLEVDTQAGERTCVLKANPFEEPNGVGLEARMLALLASETTVPVPAVYGLLDSDPDLPTPAFLMERIPDRVRQRHELANIDHGTLERIATNLGRHLGTLHQVDAIHGYGYLTPTATPTYDGERPDGSRAAIDVADPAESWPETLRDWAEIALEGLGDTPFADLESYIRAALDNRFGELTGPFTPALTHIDGSIENVVTTGDGEITAVLDWAFTLAAPPVYDLVFVEHGLAGGHWRYLPDSPDLQPVVQRGLLDGYSDTGTSGVLEQFRADRDSYRLVALSHSLCHADDWFDQHDVSADERAPAHRNHRRAVADLL